MSLRLDVHKADMLGRGFSPPPPQKKKIEKSSDIPCLAFSNLIK